MKLGNNIDISLSLDNPFGNTSVHYNGNLIGGIQSVKLEVGISESSQEEISKFVITMWDPREMYVDEDRLRLQMDFIADARKLGAEVNLRSFLETTRCDDAYGARESEVNHEGDNGLAKLAAVCVAIAGAATLLGSNNKKQKVQKVSALAKLNERQYKNVSKK